jgi:hypothetical protein
MIISPIIGGESRFRAVFFVLLFIIIERVISNSNRKIVPLLVP